MVTLYSDAKDLALTIPPSQNKDLANMSVGINGLEERFVDVDQRDEDVSGAWVRNQKRETRGTSYGPKRT